MFSRREIENYVEIYVKQEGVRHISDMCEEIQNRIFSQVTDRLYYAPDKYTQSRAGLRNSKFVELCSDENWEYAEGIADRMNKEILTQTECFKKFVKMVKTSPEYVSIIRNMKLGLLEI